MIAPGVKGIKLHVESDSKLGGFGDRAPDQGKRCAEKDLFVDTIRIQCGDRVKVCGIYTNS